MNDEAKTGTFIGCGAIVALCILVGGGCFAHPQYRVYSERLAGEAKLAESESSRKIAIEEAKAKLESAKMLAQAEVERAKGVAEANKIIGEGLKGHEEYLTYLWILGLEHVAQAEGSTVIYVPTNGNLPIMEAGRGVKK